MLKRILLVIGIFVFVALVSLAYYYFWPRYKFKIYGYHDVKVKNDHGEWWIELQHTETDPIPSMDFSKWQNRVNPMFKKVSVYRSPYILRIWHNSDLKIHTINMVNDKKIVVTKKEGKLTLHEEQAVTVYENIDICYRDYDLIIYYSAMGRNDTLRLTLKTNFSEENVSLFEIGTGI